MAERVSQVTPETLVTGDPDTRVSQVTPESLVSGDVNARVSQVTPESLVSGDVHVRVSQVTPEGLVAGNVNVRVSQIVVEILLLNIEVFMPIVYPSLPGRGYSTHVKPKAFNMPTAVMDSGARIDLSLSDTPLLDFELTYNFLRGQGFQYGSLEFKTMFVFFMQLNGNAGRFLFPWEDDREVSSQLIATADGVGHTFPLVRTISAGGFSTTEPIGYVDLTLPFRVYDDGVEISNYTVITTQPVNQILDIGYTPTAGHEIRVDMSYFYYCNFPADSLDFEKFMYSLWNLKTVQFSSNRANT